MFPGSSVKPAALFLLCVIVICALAGNLVSQAVRKPMTTADHLQAPGWWPTKGSEPREHYVGSAACASCHSRIVESQKTTQMANAAERATPAAFAKYGITGPVTAAVGDYRYEVRESGDSSVYSASNGAHSVTTPLSWVFGNGHFGFTYLFEQKGTFYESNLSYYPLIKGLDFTPGHIRSAPASLPEALGVPQDSDSMRLCFGCHTSAATTSNHFDPVQSTAGITCESCHGPGAQHVATMTLANDSNPASTFALNPASLGPSDSVDFCGACHRTRRDIVQVGLRGLATIRFPAYRLQDSHCWGSDGDARVTCVACHDPHRPLVEDAASYDKNCLACHALAGASMVAKDHPGAACPVARNLCVTCHMPKYEIPGLHGIFTDHKIAVLPKGEPFTE